MKEQSFNRLLLAGVETLVIHGGLIRFPDPSTEPSAQDLSIEIKKFRMKGNDVHSGEACYFKLTTMEGVSLEGRLSLVWSSCVYGPNMTVTDPQVTVESWRVANED